MNMIAVPGTAADGPPDHPGGSAATTPPPGAGLPVRAADALAPGTELPSHYARCIGCGSEHPCGLHLRVRAAQGLAVVGVCAVGEHHQGAPGLAHGGMLVTVLDEVMGALNWLLMAPAVTGRVEVDFRAPVPVGTELHLRAWITGAAGRKVYCAAQGRLGGPAGPVAVSSTGLFLQVPLEHFARHGNPADVARAARGSGEPKRPWLEINP